MWGALRALGAIAAQRRAVVSIEFAIIAPVMVLMAGGAVEMGLLLRVYTATQRLAVQYAISYADCPDTVSGACQTEAAEYATASAIGNVAPQLVPGQLTLTIIQAHMTGTTPAAVYAYPVGSTLTATQIAAVDAVSLSGENAVVVTAAYQHTLLYFPAMMNPLIGQALQFSYTVAQLK
jgi:Flp pilus assembly protein TadG